jgi:hypothetical protein
MCYRDRRSKRGVDDFGRMGRYRMGRTLRHAGRLFGGRDGDLTSGNRRSSINKPLLLNVARILLLGGYFARMWNRRDLDDDLQNEIEQVNSGFGLRVWL